ncbi:alpha/beta fold hydrolase [Endozoicomonadaceae bacterium StTr2]
MNCMNPDNNKTPAGTSYSIHGQGMPVVLIHGVGLNKSMWGGQLAGLADQFQLISYDMLGHGHSQQPADGAGLQDYADQLRELLDHLQIPRATVIGFSMGGLVARAFALAHPDYLSGLVIMNSVFGRTDEQRRGVQARTREVAEKGPAANVDAALERWFSREYRAASPAQIELIRQTLGQNSHQGYLKTYDLFASQDNYMADQLHQIRTPSLVITGELDSGSTPHMAQSLARAIPGALCEVLPEQRHMMPMESPREVNHHLRTFLSNLSATRESLV